MVATWTEGTCLLPTSTYLLLFAALCVLKLQNKRKCSTFLIFFLYNLLCDRHAVLLLKTFRWGGGQIILSEPLGARPVLAIVHTYTSIEMNRAIGRYDFGAMCGRSISMDQWCIWITDLNLWNMKPGLFGPVTLLRKLKINDKQQHFLKKIMFFAYIIYFIVGIALIRYT